MSLDAALDDSRPLRRGLVWGGALFIAVIAALAASDIVRGHRDALAQTGQALDTQARIIAEQTARSVQAVDVVLRHVAEQHRAGALDALADAELHAFLREQAVGLVQVESLVLLDAEGTARASSRRYPLPALPPQVGTQFSAFVEARAQASSELLIGRAVKSPADGQMVIPMVRRLVAPGGAFDGVVGGRGRVDYFQQFYRDIHLDAGTTVTLLHRDGTLLARHPAAPAAIGQRFPGLEAYRAAYAAGGGAPARAVSPVDGVERFGAVQSVAGYPLVVLVTRDTATALAPWREQALGSALRTLTLAGLALLLLALAMRQFARLDATRRSLSAAQERFTLAVDGSDDGLWDWDRASGRIFASARAREILGLAALPETQPSDEFFAALQAHPEDEARRWSALDAHIAGRSAAYEQEFRVRRAGEWRWVRVRGVCVRDAQGRAERMAGSISDVDERRRAEEALRESEERFALAVAGSADGVFVWDIEADRMYTSPRTLQLVGCTDAVTVRTRAEWLAILLPRLHPQDRDRHAIDMKRHLRGETAVREGEYRVRQADGDYRWLRVRGTSVRDAAGKAVRWAGSVSDIDAAKRAEEALRISEQRFALAVEGSDDGIWLWDYESGRAFASRRGREIVGLPEGPEEQSIGDWFAQLEQRLHPEDVARRRQALDDHLAGRSPAYAVELRVARADGGWRWISARGMCLRDADGRALRIAGSVSDIDEQKRAEEALRVSEERYALAMAGLRGGHWVWETKSDALFVSGTWNELFGLPADTPATTRTAHFARVRVHPEDAARLDAIAADLAAGRLARADYEYRIVLDDGTLRWIGTRLRSFPAEAGGLRVAGVSIDVTERKRTEEALRLSEERYALAMSGSHEGHWVWDLAAKTVFVSPALAGLFCLPRSGVMAEAEYFDRLPLHPEDRERVHAARADHVAGRTPRLDHEFRILRGDGAELRWVHTRGQCFRDAAGRPTHLAGATLDVTDRHLALAALRESEQRFALAVEGSNDGILDWDIASDRMFVSERALRLFGLEPGVGAQTRADWAALLLPRFHPEDAPRLEAELRDSARDPAREHEGEYRVRGADGSYRWMRLRGRSVRDAGGRSVRWAGSLSDIDAIKRSEEALRRSEQRYQLAVEGSNEGLWDWDLTNDLLFLSPRAQQLTFLEPGEPLRPRREWIARTTYHPEDLAVVRRAIAEHLHGRTPHFEVQYRLQHHSGSWHWYRQRGVALRDASGRPWRMAGSMEDITETKRAEAERDRLEGQLRQAQKLEAIGTLAGGIAHDFNNILAAILGFGEMAQRESQAGSAQRRHLDAVLGAALRAKSLVERILAFSRSGVGERVPVDVASVVEEALQLVGASLPAGIVLERHLDAPGAGVLGDPTQIHQVVMNLCANAVQAMRQGSAGTLAVRLECVALEAARIVATSTLAPGRYTRLAVSDTGVGISPRVLERIFDPFFTTREVGVGTGLGLSLVHGIVADLGGGIDVDSAPGRGATFSVYLPWRSHRAGDGARSPDAPLPLGQGETVLLVDDEEALVRLGEELLAELGYEPVGFASSSEALQSFRAEPGRFQLVVSDEAMPDMTGSELAGELRALCPALPIVLVSGYVTPALSACVKELGGVELLAKPLSRDELARTVAKALRR